MDKKFITLAETMKMLSLSRQTINRFIARKEIPNYKVGKRRLFDPEELVEWVKSHKDDKPKKRAKKEKREKRDGQDTRGSQSHTGKI
jgi:excisionase family DNA binding protein